MRRPGSCIVFLLALVLPGWAQGEPLTLGVVPYTSPGQLMELHDPLRRYLQERLALSVDFVTAPDYAQFVARTSRGEYDLLLTAPHLARFAATRSDYRPLALTRHRVRGVFLVRRDSGIHALADLKGKVVMIAQPLSIIYQLAKDKLRRHGLVDGQNIAIIATRTHNNALNAPGRGEADASVTGVLLWQGADESTRANLRQIDATFDAPGPVLMAHKRLPGSVARQAKAALMEFGQTRAGEGYFRSTGFEGFASPDERTMRAMDAYARLLAEPPR